MIQQSNSTKTVSQVFNVGGMTCASCAGNVRRALLKLNGVLEANVNLASETVSVVFLPSIVNGPQLALSVERAGYSFSEVGEGSHSYEAAAAKSEALDAFRNQAIASLSVALLLVVLMNFYAIPLLKTLSVSSVNWIMFALATPVQIWVGRQFYVAAWKAFRSRYANMSTLIAVGITAAYLYSVAVTIFPPLFVDATFSSTGEPTGLFSHVTGVYYEVAVFIMGFVILGRWLEGRAKFKTGGALRRLARTLPQTASVLNRGTVEERPIEEVLRGDIVLVKPGGQIPVDGAISEGDSILDESMITGESIPVEKGLGDTVFAGTLNSKGALKITADTVGRDTVAGRIIQIVEQAQASRAPVELLADRITSKFVPVVLLLAAGVFVLWAFLAPQPWFPNTLLVTVGVLVIACPCALGLATPVAMVVAIGRAAAQGILVRDASALEVAGSVNLIALDKTGTITEGSLRVTSIHASRLSASELINLAASVEYRSEHPIAQAILTEGQERSSEPLLPVSEFEALPGMGASGNTDIGSVAVGSRAFMESLGAWDSALSNISEEMMQRGETTLFVALNRKSEGVIGVADRIRPSSADAVQRFKNSGIRTVMLTGDNLLTAREIAKQVGIDEVHAGMLPEDKAEWIRKRRSEGLVVAMVGDGVNDAPAILEADQSMAVASGVDIAVETAQVTLINSDLRNAADFFLLGRLTMKTVKQNLFWGFFYNLLLIPIAAGILYPFFGGEVPSFLEPVFGRHGFLNPILAAAAMAFSSLTVVLNSLRMGLSRRTPPPALPRTDGFAYQSRGD